MTRRQVVACGSNCSLGSTGSTQVCCRACNLPTAGTGLARKQATRKGGQEHASATVSHMAAELPLIQDAQ